LFDPRELGDGTIEKLLLEAGHRTDFFDYKIGYEPVMSEQGLTIAPNRDDRHREGANRGAVVVEETGLMVLENNVTGLRNRGNASSLGLAIAEQDLETQLNRAFSFANALLEVRDPYQRYSRLVCAVGLFEISYQTLVANLPSATESFTVPMRNDGAECKLDPRTLSRQCPFGKHA